MKQPIDYKEGLTPEQIDEYQTAPLNELYYAQFLTESQWRVCLHFIRNPKEAQKYWDMLEHYRKRDEK